MPEHFNPTLTDAKGMGGVIAQGGFDYQMWDALVRLPGWLRTPVFEGVTVEGLEDVEARFFAPHAAAGHVLDRFQAKSATPARAQLLDVFRGFAAFDRAHPELARAQVLVTPALPKDLQWLARDADRVRRARPFYAPFAAVVAASEQKVEQRVIEAFAEELGPETARQTARSVEIDLQNFPNRAAAEAGFGAALGAAFPDLDPSARRVASAFRTLEGHIGGHRGEMVDRAVLLNLLAASLGESVFADTPLPVHVRSDRNAPEEYAVEIDASPFSATDGPPPSQAEWQSSLLVPLERTARWAHRNRYGRLRLAGSYRISTAFALGWAFRAATGFELEVATRDGDWVTDDRADPRDARLPWRIVVPDEVHGGRLVVSVGVLRDPVSQVVTASGLTSAAGALTAYLDQPITNGRQAQDSAQAVKTAVAEAVNRLRSERIDLYFAGPAALAVAIGHRWNAMPTTQLHEFRPGEGYVRSARLT